MSTPGWYRWVAGPARRVERVARRCRRWVARLPMLDDPRFRENQVDDGAVLNEARFEGQSVVGRGVILVGDVRIGYASTLGRVTVLWGGSIQVGRYSQLAPHVAVYAVNHPYRHITSYVNDRLLEGRMQHHLVRSKATIGSDVWLGHGVIVLSNLTIGDGAVVGAGSVVTKHVPPYAVAVGNPARVIASRFPPPTIDKLLRLRWWDLNPGSLARLHPLFEVDYERDPGRFGDLLDEALAGVAEESPGLRRALPAQTEP